MLAVLHLASVVVEFRLVAVLHRWLMTYAEGFHRRKLVGTVFQFLVGHQSREAQIKLGWAAVAFAAFAFHNERSASSEVWRRVARAGRDEPGKLMAIDLVINDSDPAVTVRAAAQAQRAIIGRGPHRRAPMRRRGSSSTAAP